MGSVDDSEDLLRTIRGVGINLDRIDYVYVIDGYIVNEAPLRVGKGSGGFGEVDLPVIRLPSGKPYIPGSSIKGVLRSMSESMIRSMGYKACEPNPKSVSFNECSFATEFLTKLYYALLEGRASVEALKEIVNELWRRYADKFERGKVDNVISFINSGNLKDVVNYVISDLGPCLACQVFGNTALASHVDVTDAAPASKDIPVLSRTRVSIDRFRGAARSGALFNYEFVPPGIEWRFKLIIKNIDVLADEPKSRVLRALLAMLTNTSLISVGGMTSVGLGTIRLDPAKTRIVKYVIKDFEVVEELNKPLLEVIK